MRRGRRTLNCTMSSGAHQVGTLLLRPEVISTLRLGHSTRDWISGHQRLHGQLQHQGEEEGGGSGRGGAHLGEGHGAQLWVSGGRGHALCLEVNVDEKCPMNIICR